MTKPFALVIEDHEEQALTFHKALEAAGYEVEEIHSGEVAQTRLKETEPTLVLLDLHIPNISGDVLLKQIRADARLEKTRVFLTTADARLAETLRSDATLVLLKPISFTQLIGLAARYHPDRGHNS